MKKSKNVKAKKVERVHKKSNSWMVISIVIGVLLVASLVLGLTGVLSSGSSGEVLSQASAEAKANEYVNLLSNAEMPLSVSSVSKVNGLFKIDVSILGQTESWYMAPDGNFLFPSAFSLDDVRTIVAQQQLQGAQQEAPAAQGDVNVDLEDVNSLGSGSVVMVEYSSATCPFCARYHSETLPLIKSEYIDTGKITYVYKHYLRGSEADILAANAMECAGEQGKFFDYMNKVYANQNLLSQSTIYSTWASELDLNVDDFDACFSERRYTEKANADTMEGRENGITGTPGFLVNSRIVSGAQPFANFQSAIELELAN